MPRACDQRRNGHYGYQCRKSSERQRGPGCLSRDVWRLSQRPLLLGLLWTSQLLVIAAPLLLGWKPDHLPHVQALVTIEWLASHRFLVVRVLVSGRSRSRCLHICSAETGLTDAAHVAQTLALAQHEFVRKLARRYLAEKRVHRSKMNSLLTGHLHVLQGTELLAARECRGHG